MELTLDRLLARHCAPALLGVKPANLVSLPLEEYRLLAPQIAWYSQCASTAGAAVSHPGPPVQNRTASDLFACGAQAASRAGVLPPDVISVGLSIGRTQRKIAFPPVQAGRKPGLSP